MFVQELHSILISECNPMLHRLWIWAVLTHAVQVQTPCPDGTCADPSTSLDLPKVLPASATQHCVDCRRHRRTLYPRPLKLRKHHEAQRNGLKLSYLSSSCRRSLAAIHPNKSNNPLILATRNKEPPTLNHQAAASTANIAKEDSRPT